MFDKFGEFSSCGEMNTLAENLFNEGDMKSIRILAKENGIPEEQAEAYIQGDIPELCDAMTAAIGKLEMEEKELKPKDIMEDWTQYIKSQCMENELIAHQVRKKGKSLKGCIAAILVWSFKNQHAVDKEIISKAGIKAGKVTMGIPGMGNAKRIIRDYYMEAVK